MNTAKAYFEIYKALPGSVKSKVFSMIIRDESPLLSEIEQSLHEVNEMEKGQKPQKNIRDLIQALRHE